MKNIIFMTIASTFTCSLLASCNGGGSSVNPTPSPSPFQVAKYAYIANSSINSSLYLCGINTINGELQNCEKQLDSSIPIVNDIAVGSSTLYISYHAYSSVEGVYSYQLQSNGIVNLSSLVNNSSINTYYQYQDYISTFNNILYVVNDSSSRNYDISNCGLDSPNWLTIGSCSNFDSSTINLAGVVVVGRVAFNQNRYAYFITYHNDIDGQYNVIAQCQLSNSNSGALINCTANNSFNSTNYLTSMTVTDSNAYIFNSDEKSINVCPITANGTLGTCQKQQPVNSAGQNMMGATAISPIVRNNRLFFVNSAPDAATSSAVVSCPISATGKLGACTTSATATQFASPQAMTMI